MRGIRVKKKYNCHYSSTTSLCVLNMQNNSIDKTVHVITENSIVGCEVTCKIQWLLWIISNKQVKLNIRKHFIYDSTKISNVSE